MPLEPELGEPEDSEQLGPRGQAEQRDLTPPAVGQILVKNTSWRRPILIEGAARGPRVAVALPPPTAWGMSKGEGGGIDGEWRGAPRRCQAAALMPGAGMWRDWEGGGG